MVTSPANIFYLTGFLSNPYERFMGLVVDCRKDQFSLFIPALDFDEAKKMSYVRSNVPIDDSENPYEKLADKIGLSPHFFGVEKNLLTLFQYEQLKQYFPQARFKDIEGFITLERLKKSSEEIRIIHQAVEMVENVLERGIKNFKVGMTELELTAELEYQMRVLGADGPASTIVLSGDRSAFPHGRSRTREIVQGDLLLIDTGVFINGYCSDITRTFLIGEGTEEQVKIYETVLKANQEAIDAVKIGDPIGKIDQAARDHIEESGYGNYFTTRVGHGIGLEIHEAPSIHKNNDMRIQPGFVFTIEPGIYIPEIGGVRIEDDVYVTEDGEVEVLTRYPKDLVKLG